MHEKCDHAICKTSTVNMQGCWFRQSCSWRWHNLNSTSTMKNNCALVEWTMATLNTFKWTTTQREESYLWKTTHLKHSRGNKQGRNKRQEEEGGKRRKSVKKERQAFLPPTRSNAPASSCPSDSKGLFTTSSFEAEVGDTWSLLPVEITQPQELMMSKYPS